MTSKATIIPSDDVRPPQSSPESANPEALTALMIIGVTMGRKRMGSIISRALVLTARAENRVPTAAKPIVVKNVIAISCSERTARLKRKAKIAKDISSIISRKNKLPNILPT